MGCAESGGIGEMLPFLLFLMERLFFVAVQLQKERKNFNTSFMELKKNYTNTEETFGTDKCRKKKCRLNILKLELIIVTAPSMNDYLKR